jgi:hypothetical protein
MNSKDNLQDSRKLLEIELAQSFETFRALLALPVSAFAILVAANVALVGYALTNQRALVLGTGGLFPLAGLAILLLVGRMLVPTFYTALKIENELEHHPDLFFWSFLEVMARSSVPRFRSVIALDDSQERMASLRRRFGSYMPLGRFTPWGLLALAALQVLAVPLLNLVFGWPLI